jgi:HTH-type transcriptional regulator/antitoxin HipB
MYRLSTARDIGALIRDRRQEAGLTQEQLAAKAQVGRQWLVAFESGAHDRAEIAKVLAVLAAVGVRLYVDDGEVTQPGPATAGEPSVDLNELLRGMRSGD